MSNMIGKTEALLAIVLIALVSFSIYQDLSWDAEYRKICDTRGC